MGTRFALTTVVAVWLTAAAAAAAPGQGQTPPNALASADRLACTFTFYTVGLWAEGVPEVRSGDDALELAIEGIDTDAHTAQIVAAGGTAEVSSFLTGTGLTLIEQTPIGNFIVTSIFTAGRSGDSFHAVHSRHLGDLNAPPTPSQYFGSCRVVS